MKKSVVVVLTSLFAAAIVLVVFLSATSGLILQWLWIRSIC